MCLAIPGRILTISGEDFTRAGKVDFGGVFKDVSLAYVPEARVGDYVIVHVGFALSVLDEEEARQTLACFRELDELAAGERGESGSR
ncbi:MAG: HypC/HybG/HupF family hydrogenase formation chaperone [Kiritimatiellae bacterium]|nr:HypC/HybG/HupF family hydrogenase formation chaperone [Kiritimatiellia bacterium]